MSPLLGLTCAVCGYSHPGPLIESEFECRGMYQGKSVYKCCRCGSGLFVGNLSGLWGKSSVIPSHLWAELDRQWNESDKTW
jgi:hypothetical protein